MRQLNLPAQTTKYELVNLRGGLDLVTPLLQLPAGYVRDSQNWQQSINGGYSYGTPYERVDGRPAPSDATYLTLTVTITGAIAVGDTVTGVTSAATGQVISLTASGSDYIVALTKTTGSFVDAETLNVSAVPQGTIAELGGVGTDEDYDVTQLNLAADVYRADITAVPGSGSIRGVASLNGVRYAWRDNAGGTALEIYKTSSSGWTAVSLGNSLTFTAGTSEYVAGDTITQGGASATVLGVAVESGTWAGGTAAGRIIIGAVTGGPFAAGAAVGGGAATLSGAETAQTLLPGGHIQTDTGNFGGGKRLYGCDGVNQGFEFDGTAYIPITTGNTPDVPDHVLVHKDHLWFAFGDNLQNSSIASTSNLMPQFNWTAGAGSAAYRCNGDITSLQRQPGDQSGGAMSVCTQNGTEMIYGSSAANFQKVAFEESAGSRPYGAQRLGGQTFAFGDTGVFALSATQAFGNFTPATMTMNIRPWTQVRRNLCTASLVNREKSQYRVFFSDGYGLYMTIVNGKLIGSMPVLFPNPVTCACQGDSPDGEESAFFGSTDGFVYQLDAGTSHDGADMTSYLTLAFANQGGPRVLKRYRGAEFEVQGGGYASFEVTSEIGYGGADRPQGDTPQTATLNLSSAYWDSGYLWDTINWDGRSLTPSSVELQGTGENLALRVECNSDKYPTFTLNSVILHYTVRKGFKK